MAVSLATSAYADECKDILQDSTRATALYRQNSLYRQYVNQHFVRSGFQQSQTDTSVTGKIPLGKIVLDGEYDEERYRQRQERLERSLVWDLQHIQSTDILLATGDPTIVRAWSDCMTRRGGFSIHFTQVTGKAAIAELKWYPMQKIPEVRISTQWRPPPTVNIVNGADCLKSGYVHYAFKTCVVQFSFDSARTPLLISINTDQGAASSYLPPRIYAEEEDERYSFADRGVGCESPATLAVEGLRKRSSETAIGRYCAPEGWFFKKEETTLTPTISNVRKAHLQQVHADVEYSGLSKATVKLGCVNSSEHHDLRCHLSPAFVLTRVVVKDLP